MPEHPALGRHGRTIRATSPSAACRSNLGFALVYVAIGAPLVAGVQFQFNGCLLSPMIAALAMSLSSASVIGNALRLRRARL